MNKIKRVDMRIDDDTLQKLDELSTRFDMTRSKLIRFLIQNTYKKNNQKTVSDDYMTKLLQDFKNYNPHTR